MASLLTIRKCYLITQTCGQGYVDNGVFHEIFPLGLKGRFYVSVSLRPKGKILRYARRFVHNGDTLRKVFWRISALVFEQYCNIIKGRLYANH